MVLEISAPQRTANTSWTSRLTNSVHTESGLVEPPSTEPVTASTHMSSHDGSEQPSRLKEFPILEGWASITCLLGLTPNGVGPFAFMADTTCSRRQPNVPKRVET